MLGRHHPILKRVTALVRDRALRDREGVFVAEGIHAATEALRADADVEFAIVAPRLDATPEGPDLLRAMARNGVAVHVTSDDRIDRIQDARTAQPVVLVVRRGPTRDVPPDGPVVVTAGVQDPGNVGTLVRTAAAAGARAFVCCGGGADPYHPRAVRATAGAVFRLQPRVGGDVGPALDRLAGEGRRIAVAAADGDTPYGRFPWHEPFALVLGSEAHGAPDEAVRRADARVSIPMAGQVESLSVGAAAAVLLFEAARVRRGGVSDG